MESHGRNDRWALDIDAPLRRVARIHDEVLSAAPPDV